MEPTNDDNEDAWGQRETTSAKSYGSLSTAGSPKGFFLIHRVDDRLP